MKSIPTYSTKLVQFPDHQMRKDHKTNSLQQRSNEAQSLEFQKQSRYHLKTTLDFHHLYKRIDKRNKGWREEQMDGGMNRQMDRRVEEWRNGQEWIGMESTNQPINQLIITNKTQQEKKYIKYIPLEYDDELSLYFKTMYMDFL